MTLPDQSERDVIAKYLDTTILVAARPEVQLARLTARDGLTPEDGRARIAAQMPLEDKRERADHVLENDGELDDLTGAVDDLLRRLQEPAPLSPGA